MGPDENERRSLADLVDASQAEGRYTVDRVEATAALQVSSPMLKKAAMHLSTKSRIG